MLKMHWIRDDRRKQSRKIITHCGKEGWTEQISDEFTDGMNIFEATDDLSKVKCGRCLKSAERISNSPWGCKRSSAITPFG